MKMSLYYYTIENTRIILQRYLKYGKIKKKEEKTMKNELTQMYLTANSKYFESSAIPMIKTKLDNLDDDKYAMLQAINLKDPMMMTIISVFVGGLGVDRFMLGDIGLGIAKLLTGGGCGIWLVIDWFMIGGKTKQKNLAELYKVL